MVHLNNLFSFSTHSYLLFLYSLITPFCLIVCSSSSSYFSLPSSSFPYSSSLPLTGSSSKTNAWTLMTTKNPHCADYKSCSNLTSQPDLVYTQSTDNQTSIHFISSSLGGFPGLLISRTSSPDALKINWDSLLGDCRESLNFSTLPQDSIGILLLNFFNFDHKEIHWSLMDTDKSLNCDSSKCSYGYTTDSGQSSINQTISFGLEMANVQSSFEDFPHLQFTPTSMHIDVQIKNIDKSLIDKKVGGVNLLIVTPGNSFNENYEQSIDDEHSPGIFTKRTLTFSKENTSESNSYIQWKPIAYKSKDRVMSKTMEIESSTLTETELPKLNLPLYCFYSQLADKYSVYELNVSFVQDADSSTSDKIDLITWSLVFGLNSPSQEKLSLFIKLMIFVGVGLSFFVMFISLVYVTIKKWTKFRAQRESGLLNEVFLDY